MERFFKLSQHKTDTRTEIMAGITTFMTLAYILAVNPNILSASGMDSGAKSPSKAYTAQVRRVSPGAIFACSVGISVRGAIRLVFGSGAITSPAA